MPAAARSRRMFTVPPPDQRAFAMSSDNAWGLAASFILAIASLCEGSSGVLSVAAEADGVSRALVVGVIEGEAVALATAKRSNLNRDLHVLRREVVGALGEVSVVQAGFLLLGRRSHVTEAAQAEVVAAVAHVDKLNGQNSSRDAPADGVRDGDSLNPELRPDLANRLDLAAAEDDLAESRAPRSGAHHTAVSSAPTTPPTPWIPV